MENEINEFDCHRIRHMSATHKQKAQEKQGFTIGRVKLTTDWKEAVA